MLEDIQKIILGFADNMFNKDYLMYVILGLGVIGVYVIYKFIL